MSATEASGVGRSPANLYSFGHYAKPQLNMETLDVQAKDFLVKWVNAPESSSIKWQVKSLKKSINFAIYQKTEPAFDADDSPPEKSIHSQEMTNSSEHQMPLSTSSPRLRSSSVSSVNTLSRSSTFKSRSRSSTFSSTLNNSGLKLVKNYHKLLPDELMRGSYQTDNGGTFAFIFDNTFSKTTSKKVLFSTKLGKNEAFQSEKPNTTKDFVDKDIGTSLDGVMPNVLWPKDGEMMQGVLCKKRRKKLQGFTKRFFILNFKYGTLSYFKMNDNKLRGQMPITESIVSADEKTGQIFIDSGMEVWNLRALNLRDFKAWIDAFRSIKKENKLKSDDDVSNSANLKESMWNTKLRQIEQNIQSLISRVSTSSSENIESDLRKIHSEIFNIISHQESSDVTSLFSEGEFFDANEDLDEDGLGVVLMAKRPQTKLVQSDEESVGDNETVSDKSTSDSDGNSEVLPAPITASSEDSLVAESALESDDLYPLPLASVERDCDIPICDHFPPSLLSFVRKNVGKDLSSLSMPVDMNEPITILQKYAEMFEYSDIIDNALQGDYSENSGEFILRISAFSISYLAAMRVKVRSTRKPFNPLLGETYELVREDKGFRMVCEKVSHRPPVFAMIAESRNWTLSFSPSPSQKFWGKTSEFYTSGSIKLTIRKTGEVFTWSQPTCVLKNIIAGEKFMEPSTSVTVKSSSGQKAVIDFAKGGMFSGRSEELTIKAFDTSKRLLPYCVTGKWTESMTLKTNSTEKIIWTAGELLPQSEKKFGFTKYAGTLNKITSIEKDNLPPTDSRYRPDMLAYEKGNVEDAEVWKQKLEEAQRIRRKDFEESDKKYEATFFQHVGSDLDKPDSGEWQFKTGKLSYWERRKNLDWTGLPNLW